MSDIEPRPWEVFGEQVAVSGPSMTRGRRIVDSKAALEHAVACVNAIHAAGIPPAALAADTECVRKLVEAAREVLTSVPSSYDNDDPMVQRHARALNALPDVFRACGIEVGA